MKQTTEQWVHDQEIRQQEHDRMVKKIEYLIIFGFVPLIMALIERDTPWWYFFCWVGWLLLGWYWFDLAWS